MSDGVVTTAQIENHNREHTVPTLFPTTVIGSLPRPAWVRDLILDRKAGEISEEDANTLLDRAIEDQVAHPCGTREAAD